MIPYAREPEYLSPSSFNLFERDRVRYYLEKMGPAESIPSRESSLPMDVGTMFDGMLCCLHQQEGIPEDWFDKPEYPIARDLFFGYVEMGGWERLNDQGIKETQRELWGVVPDTDIPIHGFADVITDRIVDWKTTGSQSVKQPSPPSGYLWSQGMGKRGRFRKTSDVGPMHEISDHWAAQLAIYNWIVHEDIRPYVGEIHLMQPGPRLTIYEATITEDYQRKLRRRMEAAWETIQTQTLFPEDFDMRLARLM